MTRKIGLIVCAWALVWILGTGVYADTTLKLNTTPTIEIYSPEIGTEGDVILKKDTLYVKFHYSGKSAVYMSLYRTDPEFYLGSQPKSDVTFVPSGDFDDLTEEQKLDYRRVVYSKKNRAEDAYKASTMEYSSALSLAKKTFGDVAKMEALRVAGGFDAAQAAVAERYKKAAGDVAVKKKEYATVKALYDKLFTERVYGPKAISTVLLDTGQDEIPGVKPGTYVLAFAEKADGTKIIKTVEFRVCTSENALEQMLDTLPETRILSGQ